jgi:2'-5' RNA ligase
METSATGSVGPSEPPWRLFCAVELSEDWRDWIGEVTNRLRRRETGGYRWLDPRNLHLTVLFLGAVPRQSIAVAIRAFEEATAEPVDCRLKAGQLGGFGGRASGVVWVAALDSTGGLGRLRARLETAFDSAGIPYDRKPLKPHVTIARVRRSRDRDGVGVPSSPASPDPPPSLIVRHLTLMRSELHSAGASYQAVRRSEIGWRAAR